ncbi:MAG: hypothetical protein IJD46_01100 [Bacilli bacterium]|nr:hypothetical protein [Bacilli bacterium]
MINNDSDIEKIWIPNGEDQIWNEANFGMTWRGFFVKNKGANGWVEVSSENDVAVFKTTEIEKIKIGRIGETKDGEIIYGIKIADDNGNSVLITRDDGTLWLENKLSIETYNENNSV